MDALDALDAEPQFEFESYSARRFITYCTNKLVHKMAESDVKYKGVKCRKENKKKKYPVQVKIRKGEEDKVSAMHEGKKIINGGYFSDPLIGAQIADK